MSRSSSLQFRIYSFVRGSALINTLAARGHNITVLSVDVDRDPPSNVHYIHLEGIYEHFFNEEDGLDLIAIAKLPPLQISDFMYPFWIELCREVLNTTGFQTLLNYPDDFKFDLVLSDYSVGPCLMGFLHKFNYPPLVGYTAFNNPPYTSRIIGGHNYFGYMPYFATKYGSRMSLWERANNLLLYAVDW